MFMPGLFERVRGYGDVPKITSALITSALAIFLESHLKTRFLRRPWVNRNMTNAYAEALRSPHPLKLEVTGNRKAHLLSVFNFVIAGAVRM
jgi:hypothetical protein